MKNDEARNESLPVPATSATLEQFEWVTLSNTIKNREYAEHLLGRLRAVYDGLASLQSFHKWHVHPDVWMRMQTRR